MSEPRQLSICLVNRNFPPVSGATGFYARTLLERLKQRGYRTSVVTIGEETSSTSNITYVKARYKGGSKVLRLIGAYRESKLLIKTALAQKHDVYIIMTDPALLNYWSAKLLSNEKWVYWSMDLFPEGFKANGLTSSQSFIYRRYQSILRKCSPSFILALGQNQLDYVKTTYYPEVEGTCLPIGLRGLVDMSEKDNDERITVGYIGNVGEAHDAYLIAETLIQLKLKGCHVLTRSYGVGSALLQSLLEGHDIEILGFLTEKELSDIDVQVVSLKDNWTHICVPSKAVSAVQKGCAIIFIGSQDSDTWHMLKNAGWRISTKADISSTISQITSKSLSDKKLIALEIAKQLEANYETGLSSFFAFLDTIKPTT